MPSNIDKAFIENLQNFTESLENIVELLKQQAEKGDAVNQMLSTLDGPKLSDISKDIKEILSVSKKVDTRTKQILEEIKETRKQKESGLFGKIQDPENKDKIVDGIKVIGLIAGGVLAIGMAFKIVGDVDFLSVVALSLSMVAVSKAFTEIAKIEELTPEKTLQVGLALIAISGAITISSVILQNFKPLSAIQMFSFMVVSSALGAGAYFIFKAVSKLEMEPEDIWKYLLLPIILPSIALGMVLSSHFMTEMAPVGLLQAVSTIFIGLALAAGAFAVSMVIKALKDKDGKIDENAIILGLTLIPMISVGIVASSWAFRLFQPIENPLQVLLGSLAMGVAILAFAPTVWILGKMDLKQVAIGSLGTVMVSVAVMASSWVLSIGNYDNYPSVGWALGTGLSIIAFTPAVLVLGIIAMSGAGALAVLAGAALTVVVSATIMGVSHVLNMGNYDKYPPLRWAMGVGLSLMAFSMGAIALGMIVITGVGAIAIGLGLRYLNRVSKSIVDTSYILSEGDYSKYPPLEWAAGVGLSLTSFTGGILAIGMFAATGIGAVAIGLGLGLLYGITISIVTISHIIKRGDYTSRIPEEWVNSLGKPLFDFTKYMLLIGGIAMTGVGAVAIMSGIGITRRLARSIVDISNILSKGDFTSSPSRSWINGVIGMYKITENVPDRSSLRNLRNFINTLRDLSDATERLNKSGIDKLNKLTASVTIMSVLDDQKLQSVISVLDLNKDQLGNIIESSDRVTTDERQTTIRVETPELAAGVMGKTKEEEMIERFDTVIEKFDQLLEHVIQDKTPESTGKKDSARRGLFW